MEEEVKSGLYRHRPNLSATVHLEADKGSKEGESTVHACGCCIKDSQLGASPCEPCRKQGKRDPRVIFRRPRSELERRQVRRRHASNNSNKFTRQA